MKHGRGAKRGGAESKVAGQQVADEWDMIDVLGLEVVPARSIVDILVLVDERLVVAPANLSRETTSCRVAAWWAAYSPSRSA